MNTMQFQAITEMSDAQIVAQIKTTVASASNAKHKLGKLVFAITRDVDSRKIRATVEKKIGLDIRETVQHVYQLRNVFAETQKGLIDETTYDTANVYNLVLFHSHIGKETQAEAVTILESGDNVRKRLQALTKKHKPERTCSENEGENGEENEKGTDKAAVAIAALEAQVAALTKELAAKDKEIEKLQGKLEEASAPDQPEIRFFSRDMWSILVDQVEGMTADQLTKASQCMDGIKAVITEKQETAAVA